MSNLEAARGAEKEFGAEVVVIMKTSKEYQQRQGPLPCPSVVVNGRVIARNNTVTYQSLKTSIMCDCEIQPV
jgi:hypothetical protein